MVKITVDDVIISNAETTAKALGILSNSIEKGEGNTTGFIGKYVVADYLEAFTIDKHTNALLIGELKVQVRSKKTKYTPKVHYEVSIADTPKVKQQKYDYYVFTRVSEDYKTCWILGCMPKEEFFQRAIFMKKGQIDPSNGYRVKADCWNMTINDLYPIDRLQLKVSVNN